MRVPIGVSNRHVHLSDADVAVLFGPNYQFKKLKDLSQPGKYACEETVSLSWPKGKIDGLRILWPARKHTQVEILASDCYKLGIQAPVRVSGDLVGTAGATLYGPVWSIILTSWVVVAQRHLHISLTEARASNLTDWQIVSINVPGIRPLVFQNVFVRAGEDSALDFHIDTDEGNAAGVTTGMYGYLVK